VGNNKPPGFSDSERLRLLQIADERHHEEWLKARRKARMETIRGWITWVTAAWALKDLLWPELSRFIKDHWH